MKKTKYLLAAVCVLLAFLSGCSAQPSDPGGQADAPLRIVCAGASEYDWTRNILGENPAQAELTLIVGNGTDLHSYQPTAQDIAAITSCDLLVYVGGVSGQWITDALESAREMPAVINMLALLEDELAEEELTAGMEADHDHEEHGPEMLDADEHVWLSLDNARQICGEIARVLGDLDPDNRETYARNCESYQAALEDLDERYRSTVENGGWDTILVADRFPFRYLVDDYGLNYYAAFAGCSAETDASFETVIFLANKLDELQHPAILVIDGSLSNIADAVLANSSRSDLPVLTLDSLQSTTAQQLGNGKSYLSAMEENLAVLQQALGMRVD